MEKENYVYILKCRGNALYTGWTNDLEKRITAHKEGKGAKYTRAHLPVELIYYETFDTKTKAMQRECEIKAMKREKKLKLLKENNIEL